MTPCQIKKSWDDNGKEQAELGTKLHYDIECFMNIDIQDNGIKIDYTHEDIMTIYEFEKERTATAPRVDCGAAAPRVEWNYFLNFAKDYPEFKPYRTEMRVYDEYLKIAGSIDMIYKNRDGSYSIFDWKRTKEISKYNIYKKFATANSIKHIPDLNFYHYSLQLNMYKYILEKNYNFKIKNLFLVRLHPNCSNYELIECKDLSSEIFALISDRIKSMTSQPQ
jgi:ATP-dependent exoDNAse (exonuclease V) beta subunit